MLVEYTGCKYSRVRWLTRGEKEESLFIAGTCDDGHNNKLSLWSLETKHLAGSELTRNNEHQFKGDVTQIFPINDALISVSSSTGGLYLYSQKEYELNIVNEWISLHKGSCNDIMYSHITHDLISCGADGIVNVVNIDTASSFNYKLSNTSLDCLDILNSQQVICGNQAGHLKVFDLRQKTLGQSMSGTLSAILCIKRNPNNAHIIASGNENGEISLWDLRKNTSMFQLSAHTSFITDMHYEPKEGSHLYTSSNDGQLLRWSISSFELNNVDSLTGESGKIPISSFHINQNDELIFAGDNEVLYFDQL